MAAGTTAHHEHLWIVALNDDGARLEAPSARHRKGCRRRIWGFLGHRLLDRFRAGLFPAPAVPAGRAEEGSLPRLRDLKHRDRLLA